MPPPPPDRCTPPPPEGAPWGEAFRVWARVGLESFGGPAGQIAAMHRIVVVEKRWVDERRFLHALNFCMLLPGPEAMQLATYLGWLRHGTAGGVLAGGLFILPGFLAILALSLLYAAASGTAAVAGLLFGLKAAVIALIAMAVLRLARRMLRTAAAAAIAAAAFVAIELLRLPFPIVVLAAGAAGFAASRLRPGSLGGAGDAPLEGESRPPRLRTLLRPLWVWLPLWLLPTALLLSLLGTESVFTRLALFLSTAASISFGGAYAVLAFVAQHAVEREGWVTASQMLDGIALGEATPGPLIQVVQFVAFLAAEGDPGGLPPIAAGVLASLLATWVVFAPSFLFVFLGAPCMEWLRHRESLQAAIAGIGAAVVGVIASLGVWFALETLFARVTPVEIGPLRLRVPELAAIDPAALGLMAAAAILLRLRMSPLLVLAVCGIAGVLLRLLQGSPA